jgi:tetratricopeptide (TPR) repeat protein
MDKIILFSLLCIVVNDPIAQTFTMNKKCREQNASGISSLKAKKYLDALDAFSEMEKSSSTNEEKEASAVGRAEALNGMEQYEDAIIASEIALKLTKNNSAVGYFQKGFAHQKLKQYELAKTSFSQVMALIEKNKEKKARAADYALLCELQFRQMENLDSAFQLIEKAIALDNTNPEYFRQKGDLFAYGKKYEAAFLQYDKAVTLGKTDIVIYTSRSDARLSMFQDKYATTDYNQLKSKMSGIEQSSVCIEFNKVILLGSKDIKKKNVASVFCK